MAKLVRLSANIDHWVNPDFVTSVIAQYQVITGTQVRARVDVKVEGMPLHRVDLGDFPDQMAAVQSVERFVADLSD